MRMGGVATMYDPEMWYESPYCTLKEVEEALGRVAGHLERVLESASISKAES